MTKRKDYQKPATEVFWVQHQCHIMQTSTDVPAGKVGINQMEAEEDL